MLLLTAESRRASELSWFLQIFCIRFFVPQSLICFLFSGKAKNHASSSCLQQRSQPVRSASICCFPPLLHSLAFAVPLPPPLTLRGALHLVVVTSFVSLRLSSRGDYGRSTRQTSCRQLLGVRFLGLFLFRFSPLVPRVLSRIKNQALPHTRK